MTPAVFLLLALAQPAPRFLVHTTDGPLAARPLAPWGDDVVSVRREGVVIPPPPIAPMVRLTTGEQILFDPQMPITLDEENLNFMPASFKTQGGTALQVPLASVVLISFKSPANVEHPLPLLMKLAREKRTHDRVLLVNGDQVVGTLAALDKEGRCQIVVEGTKEAIPRARLGILAFNTELQSKPRVRSTYARLVLTSGDRIQLSAPRLESDGVTIAGQTLFGPKVSLDTSRLAFLSVAQGPADYLSELVPAKYEAIPFLGIEWPLFRDEDGRGAPLRIGGDVFDRGLAIHSPASATYALDGKYRWFEATVGVGGARGRVRVQVLIDGKPSKDVPEGERTARDSPLSLRLDVRGARTLTLRADVGTLGDVQGMSLWGDARLVR
jgi:hypothetical protein